MVNNIAYKTNLSFEEKGILDSILVVAMMDDYRVDLNSNPITLKSYDQKMIQVHIYKQSLSYNFWDTTIGETIASGIAITREERLGLLNELQKMI